MPCSLLHKVSRILNEAVSVSSRDGRSRKDGFPSNLGSHVLTVSQSVSSHNAARCLVSPSIASARASMREFLSLADLDTAHLSEVGLGEWGCIQKRILRMLLKRSSSKQKVETLTTSGVGLAPSPLNASMRWHGVLDHVQFRVWLWRRRRYRIIA